MPPKPNRHQQRKAATRQALLEAAREVIVERGYNQVEILDITERANVSKATFYKHFQQEAVVREIMLAGLTRWSSASSRAGAAPKSARNGSRRASGTFAWAAENRELLLIMVGGRASGQLGAFGRSYLVQHIERGFDEFGLFAETDDGVPRTLKAHVIAGALIQVLGWWLESDTGYSPSEIADLLQRVLVNGLGPLTR